MMVLLTQFAVLSVYMSLWYVYGALTRRFDAADTAWGFGFIVCAVTAWTHRSDTSTLAFLATALVAVWGIRLSFHIGSRHFKRTKEDARYRKWREQWGVHADFRAFFQIFLFQAALIVLISAPVTRIVTSASRPIHVSDVCGVCIWLTGFAFEAVSDYQLARFKKKPENRGRIIRSGLWRYSRHPNYFGEVLLWWGVFLIAAGFPGGWKTLVGPLTITFLILKVSGIPMLEEHYRNHPEYQEYRRKTSGFIPLPPRKES